MSYSIRYSTFLLLVVSLSACHKVDNAQNNSPNLLFSLLPSSETGIDFSNDLVYDHDFNIYRYRNFYNGGGVAIGDVNNDGLADVFFSGNMKPNKLYINRGNLKFEDVTMTAKVNGKGSWSTGVAIADINADGKLDIYVCNSGNPRSDEKASNHFSRANECYINTGIDKNGVPVFEEQAEALGIADKGLSTHAAFFDYDRDGDLDLYMLNNSFQPIGSFDLRRNLRFTRDSLGGHKLYRNDQGHFIDVSQQSGILGSVIAFGLGVTVGDLDLDGWQDIYVSNDFFERDYLYHNNGDGTFTEQLENSMRHISAASMGADMADINNDAYPDIFVTDMLPEPDRRIKTTTSFDSPDRFRYTSGSGYYNQFTRNMLHLNNADGTFSDIACLGSMEATDWSWGALIFDMDNDGWKDIFVANGIAQDLTNQDYLLFASDPNIKNEIVNGGMVDFKRLIDSIPSEPIPNYAFHNQHNLCFNNQADQWGLAKPSFSNGSAYGDLDNDGDLDLVVNNVNSEAFVYRNNARETNPNQSHYLKFELEGLDQNKAAFGAKIYLRAQGQTFYQEQMPMRGFQSCMDPRPNFGLGSIQAIDTVLVEWPNGSSTLLKNVHSDQILALKNAESNVKGVLDKPWIRPDHAPICRPVANPVSPEWQHQETEFYDWDRDRLLFFQYSTEGPRMAIGDVNGDGLEDVFICGASGQTGAVLFQTSDGRFKQSAQPAFVADAASEDVDACLFDADGDGDLDLYVASGSNENTLPTRLADRLYTNDGKGNFMRKADAIPTGKPFASAVVRSADVDGDGDLDLFVGMRLLPGKVGVPVGGFLLYNDGLGFFEMQQPEVLKNLGMLTDAIWSDLDQDGDQDLVVVGEWMPIKIFLNEKGGFADRTAAYGLNKTDGLWKRIASADLNGDGRPDFVLGNLGLNSRMDADPEHPLTLFFNDFDQNGTPEQILCRYNSGKLLPYVLRGDLVSNLPSLKKKYLHFRNYADKTLPEIFTPEQMKNTIELHAGMLANSVLLSQPNGSYQLQALPNEAQFAPIYGIAIFDVNADGKPDLVSGGNFKGCKPEFGFMDADYGLVLLGDGKGGFKPQRSFQTGFRVDGEVRDMKLISKKGRKLLIVARNNQSPLFFDFSGQAQ